MMTSYSKIRLQVSVLRTNGPMVFLLFFKCFYVACVEKLTMRNVYLEMRCVLEMRYIAAKVTRWSSARTKPFI